MLVHRINFEELHQEELDRHKCLTLHFLLIERDVAEAWIRALQRDPAVCPNDIEELHPIELVPNIDIVIWRRELVWFPSGPSNPHQCLSSVHGEVAALPESTRNLQDLFANSDSEEETCIGQPADTDECLIASTGENIAGSPGLFHQSNAEDDN